MRCLHFCMPLASEEVVELRPGLVGVLRGPWGELEVRLGAGLGVAPEYIGEGAVLVVPNSADSEKLLRFLHNSG